MPKRSSRGRGKAKAAAPAKPAAPATTAAPATPTAAPAEAREAPPAAAPALLAAPPAAPRQLAAPAAAPAPDDFVLAPAITPSPSLADAVNLVVAQSQHRAAVEAVERGSTRPVRRPVPSQWLAAALAGWIVVALLLLVPPAIARGPEDHPWAPTPALAEASLRYGLWLAHARVEGFVQAQGRLPSFLGETGLADSSLTLTATGERSYQLEGRQGAVALTLTSQMAADSFLGGSLERLRR